MFATCARVQVAHLDRLGLAEGRHDQLRDPIAGLNRERGLSVGVQQQDPHLPSVSRVDQPGGVDQGDPISGGESGAREHQAGVTGWDLDRDPGRHTRPLTGGEGRSLGGVEVEAGVTVVGAARKPGMIAKKLDPKVHRGSVERG